VHVSDVHIRTGDQEKCRYRDYSAVFDALRDSVAGLPSPIVAITGDLFHNKSRIEAPGIRLFKELVCGLAEVCPVVLIRGNHDYRQDMDDSTDLIGALVVETPNVHYLDATGHYTFGNIGFGVVAIQDALAKGDASAQAQVEELPVFPDPREFDQNIDLTVALFHGTINGCTLQNYARSPQGYPIEWFEGYDLVLLGDVHLRQTKTRWGYAGSLIQQNFGEPLFGHGCSVWEVATRSVLHVDIKCPTGFVVVSRKDEAWMVVGWGTVDAALTRPECPDHLFVRVLEGNYSNGHELSEVFRSHGKTWELVGSFGDANTGGDRGGMGGMGCGGGVGIERKTGGTCSGEINPNDRAVWEEFLSARLSHADWKGWLACPHTLKIPINPQLPSAVVGVAESRNKKLESQIDAYLDARDPVACTKRTQLLTLRWDWILCFKGDNHLDFTRLDHKICVINGGNGCGKSSIVDTLCLALFGEAIRHNRSHPSSIVCMQKPASAVAKTMVTFSLGGHTGQGSEVYELTRSFHPQVKDARKMTTKAILTCDGRVVHTGKMAVDQWVARNIGCSQSFVRACVISQGGDEDYLKLDAASQVNVLDEAINLEPVNNLAGLFKAATLAHGAVLEALTTLHAHETLKLHNLQSRQVWAEGTLERYRTLEERARILPSVFEENPDRNDCGAMVPIDQGALERERAEVLDLLNETGGVAGSIEWGGGEVGNRESYLSLVTSLRRVRAELAFSLPPLEKPSIDKASLEDMRLCLEANRWASVSEEEIKQRIEHLDNEPFNKACWACVARKHNEGRGVGVGVDLHDELLEALERIPQLRRTRQTLLEQSKLWAAYDAQCAAPKDALLKRERELCVRAHQACRERMKQIDRLLTYKEHAEARAVHNELKALQTDHERACGVLLNLSCVQDEVKSIAENIDFYKNRKDAIDSVAEAFVGYRRWLYETRVVPALLNKANHLIARATSQQLSLVAVTSETAGNKLSIEWFFKHGPHQPPIGKASGFQRFIFGLALRIALARLGGNPLASHLFIDEGFVACDSEHLARVPTFLRALLGIYQGVVLFTHLEELKDAVDDLAQISRDASSHLSSFRLV
jgi:hypothetical protein